MSSIDKKNYREIFESDDLIYNRFDLMYSENVERYLYQYEDKEYAIDVHREYGKAKINIWGKQLPQDLFEKVIEDIFNRFPEIRYLDIKKARNNYCNLLKEENDILISLPKTVEQLLNRINGKSRYTLKRKTRLCEEECGKLETIIYNSNIPDEIVNLYFDWKQAIQGTNYHMSPEEYLRKYYVTDGILLKGGGTNLGILFFCQVNKTAYLENLSYNIELEKFSPGYLVYEKFLEELIERKCTYLFLGGGEYGYKRRFGAEESIVYSGVIYRKEVFEEINNYFEKNGIYEIAIYGLGVQGTAFLKIVKYLNVKLMYGIDQEKKYVEGLRVFSPEEKLQKVDAVIITLKSHNEAVEESLKMMFAKVFYWNDLVTGIM